MDNLAAIKNYIDSIDFSIIIDKMVSRCGWIKKDAALVCQMYRNYLFLVKKYGDGNLLPPTQDIDEFWHHHILDTKKYHSDCDAIFGSYLHHDPNLGIFSTAPEEAKKAFDAMLQLYQQEFGEPLYRVRGPLKKFVNNLRAV